MSSYTYKQIMQKAKDCKKNIKTNYKNGISSKWSYYICKAIINPNKNITKISIGDAPNPTGEKVNKKVKKADYITSCKNYIAFIEKNKKLPNYVTVAGVKISPHLFTGFVSFILADGIPAEQTINSNIYTDPNKLHDYLTNTGCAGMGQCTSYYCACNSLQQCFYRLTGIKVDEKTIAKIAGTTTSGTDHAGINTAVAWFNKKYNKNVKIAWYNFSDLGKNDNERWSKLSSLIKKGAVFCHLLYRDKYGHYEVPKSVGADNLSILNSLGDSCGSGTYCGYIESRSKSVQRRYIAGISQKSIAVLTI